MHFFAFSTSSVGMTIDTSGRSLSEYTTRFAHGYSVT